MITYDITVMFYNGNITEMAKNVFINAVAVESQDFGVLCIKIFSTLLIANMQCNHKEPVYCSCYMSVVHDIHYNSIITACCPLALPGCSQ